MILSAGTCSGIKNLKVSFYVLEDTIADTFTGTNSKGGFTIQLNGYSPRQILSGQPVGSYWMQYIFWIHGAGGTPTDYQIDTQVQYWNQNDPNVCPGGQTNPNENVCRGQQIASGRTSNTIPKFWTFEIALNDSNGNITAQLLPSQMKTTSRLGHRRLSRYLLPISSRCVGPTCKCQCRPI
jgi:hypothetical protein